LGLSYAVHFYVGRLRYPQGNIILFFSSDPNQAVFGGKGGVICPKKLTGQIILQMNLKKLSNIKKLR
jgi:hypothetical protein